MKNYFFGVLVIKMPDTGFSSLIGKEKDRMNYSTIICLVTA